MKRILFFLLLPVLFQPVGALAQDGGSEVLYSNLALKFSTQHFNGDAGTGYFPSIASSNGYGSFVDNPASVALIKDNYFNFSLLNNQVEYENSYLGNTIVSDDRSTRLGNIGFVYKIPTNQGSFVLGGGYNQLKNEKRIYRVGGRNNQSTITDQFREPTSDYYDIAFDTYAIDWGDVDSTYLESIFRIGFQNFPGITQNAEVTSSTNIGEYSFFFGTEFQENLFVGISGGITSGTYKYRRNFLEEDDQNDYEGTFIPSDVNNVGTDVSSILTQDEIDADIIGFSLRAGLIYELSQKINLGLSYSIPSTLIIRENYYSSILTELDDDSTPFESDFASGEDYEYRINRPGQLGAGFALENVGGFSLSVSGEYIDYSNLSLDLVTGNDLNFNDEVDLIDQQNELDASMEENYNQVVNIKSSLGYTFSPLFEVKTGYAYLPAKSRVFESDRNIISGGFTANLAENIILDINGQYSFWDERSELYNYYDYSGEVPRNETVDHQVSNFKILAGIRFLF